MNQVSDLASEVEINRNILASRKCGSHLEIHSSPRTSQMIDKVSSCGRRLSF